MQNCIRSIYVKDQNKQKVQEREKRKTIGNTQISTLLLCFLYLSVELMITMNEQSFV